jgi:5-methyltetrahydropteroyltriglutamate--homocysteine methyltransferase
MFTATDGRVMPTTVTGSWPRPEWFDLSLWKRPLSEAMTDLSYREQFTDAVSAVMADQERAGLDILTNGDFHLDASLAGASWLLYPVERLAGVADRPEESADEWGAPAGTILNEIFGGWRYPPVVGKIGPGIPFEFDKIWRIAQSRTNLPVKIGNVSAQVAASVLEVRTAEYDDDKRQLMWDMATAMNQELRKLADAGCKVIQIEDPMIHLASQIGAEAEYIDFLVDCLNHEIDGLDDVEVWVHTCWGNPNMQKVLDQTSYAQSLETYLERVNADVWTLEMKDRHFEDLELFKPYKGRLSKKIAIGVISHRQLQVESAEEVAADTRRALEYIEPEDLILTTDCGFGRQGCNRLIAFYKCVSLAQGANIVKRELGVPETPIRAADPVLQVDNAKRPRSAEPVPVAD